MLLTALGFPFAPQAVRSLSGWEGVSKREAGGLIKRDLGKCHGLRSPLRERKRMTFMTMKLVIVTIAIGVATIGVGGCRHLSNTPSLVSQSPRAQMTIHTPASNC